MRDRRALSASTRLATGVALLCFWGGGAYAICANPRILSSAFPRGSLSYILTPGIQPTATTSSITGDFQGFFWSVGDGHPSYLQGRDNGTFVALGETGWVRDAPGYPAIIDSTWAAARQIDGCIDESAGAKCAAVLLSDQSSGEGFFALVTAAPVQGNYSLAQGANVPIVLAALPRPQVTSVVTTPTALTASANVASPVQGLYLDPACSSSLVVGYRVYAQVLARGSAAPADLRRNGSGRWHLAAGGEAPTGQPLTFGPAAVITSDCGATEDLYLAASLVFDSGFETPHLSKPTAAISCGAQ